MAARIAIWTRTMGASRIVADSTATLTPGGAGILVHVSSFFTPARPRACVLIAVVTSWLLAPDARAQWSVDASVERFDWRERVSPIEVHEVGPRVAIGAGFMPRTVSGILLAYRGSIYGGNVGYDGSLLFDRTTAASGTSTYWGTTQTVELRYRW